jgi:hypothetical protein
MSKQLIINDETIDLGEDTHVALTYQVADIASIENRKGNVSNDFSLPKTINNNNILGQSHKVSSASDVPYQRNSARYKQDGIELFVNSFAELISSENEYKVMLLNGNADFFDKLGDTNLRDLDWSDFDHQWNLTDAMASFGNTTGYIYPICDYGILSDTTEEIYLQEMFPAPFYSELFERIASHIGWTVAGDILSEAIFQNAILAWSNDDWLHPESFITGKGALGTEAVSAQQQITYLGGSGIQFTTIELAPSTNISGDAYTASDYMYAKVTLTVDWTFSCGTGSSPADHVYASIQVYNQTKGLLLAQAQINPMQQLNLNGTRTGTVTQDCEFDQNDVIISRIMLSGNCDVVIDIDNVELLIEPLRDIRLNATIDFASTLPDMSCKDFLKGVMNQFCLIPDANSLTSVITFRKLDEVTQSKPTALNMTSKRMSGSESIKYKLNNYAQTNKLKYKIDEGVPTDLGSHEFNVVNETLDEKKDLIELPFGASDMVKRLYYSGARLDVPRINKLGTNRTRGDINRTSPRPLILKTQTLAYNLKFKDGYQTINEDTDIPLCYFSLTGESYTLDWEYLWENYYQTLEAMLDKTKVIETYYKLNTLDLVNFSNFQCWYDDEFACYLYIQKIDNYVKGKLTRVEAIKI